MQSVLVLNATYQPLSIVPAKRALQLIREEKATFLDGSGQFFHSAHGTAEIPYVILLKYVIKQGRTKAPSFSRRGILARDNYNCVYCGNPATTIDHVIPRAVGGKSTFDNCVAACLSCNGKKADRSLEQMGWTIPKKTFTIPSPLSKVLVRSSRDDEQSKVWHNYISMFEPTKAAY